jgi:uncharacterized membrane protein
LTQTNLMVIVVGFGLPTILAILALPLRLGKVRPNSFYGFRTPKTMSSPEIWYQANRFAGQWMLAASSLTLLINFSLLYTRPDLPPEKLTLWMACVGAISALLASVRSLLYLRKLQ